MNVTVTAHGIEIVTALATAAAALVAAWAVISANATARRARATQPLERRYDACVELLKAFEEIQEHRAWADIEWQSEDDYAAA